MMTAKELTEHRQKRGMSMVDFGKWVAERIADTDPNSSGARSYSRQRVYDWENDIVAVPAKVEAALMREEARRLAHIIEKQEAKEAASLKRRDAHEDQREREALDKQTLRALADATKDVEAARKSFRDVMAESFSNYNAAETLIEDLLDSNKIHGADGLYDLLASVRDGDIPLKADKHLDALLRAGAKSGHMNKLAHAIDLYLEAKSNRNIKEEERTVFFEANKSALSNKERRIEFDRTRDRDR